MELVAHGLLAIGVVTIIVMIVYVTYRLQVTPFWSAKKDDLLQNYYDGLKDRNYYDEEL